MVDGEFPYSGISGVRLALGTLVDCSCCRGVLTPGREVGRRIGSCQLPHCSAGADGDGRVARRCRPRERAQPFLRAGRWSPVYGRRRAVVSLANSTCSGVRAFPHAWLVRLGSWLGYQRGCRRERLPGYRRPSRPDAQSASFRSARPSPTGRSIAAWLAGRRYRQLQRARRDRAFGRTSGNRGHVVATAGLVGSCVSSRSRPSDCHLCDGYHSAHPIAVCLGSGLGDCARSVEFVGKISAMACSRPGTRAGGSSRAALAAEGANH